MSKRAEIAALKAYPNVEQPVWDESYPKTLFVRHTERNAYVKGYEQAEKDLALTWEDIKMIDVVMHDMATEHTYGVIRLSTFKEFYEEVLRRFNEQRKK